MEKFYYACESFSSTPVEIRREYLQMAAHLKSLPLVVRYVRLARDFVRYWYLESAAFGVEQHGDVICYFGDRRRLKAVVRMTADVRSNHLR